MRLGSFEGSRNRVSGRTGRGLDRRL